MKFSSPLHCLGSENPTRRYIFCTLSLGLSASVSIILSLPSSPTPLPLYVMHNYYVLEILPLNPIAKCVVHCELIIMFIIIKGKEETFQTMRIFALKT